ncbi:hypothetical protein JW906_00355, partial [bacterium]|nr:hypothetical protein [bacterium]
MKLKSLILSLLCLATSGALLAQMTGLHGDFRELRIGLHAGNQFRTNFFNDGTFGVNNYPPDIGGEWPINSGHIYMLDGNTFVGSEVLDINNQVKRIFSEVKGPGTAAGGISSGDAGPEGDWWTFLPLPGFANPEKDSIAMSKWPWAWPPSWPDKFSDAVDPGWPGKWNGYFGKNVFNADEESYFVTDDYNNREFQFYPDSTDTLRKGLGMRMYVRGFQWSNALVEDALFVLMDIENIGTHDHDKTVFAYKFGNNMGDVYPNLWDAGDDLGGFNKELDIAYLYDRDDIGAGGYTPVGYFGGAFLESPGNPYDGIDNDNDGISGSGPTISEAMFAPKELRIGDQIVLIDYTTFARSVINMPDDTVKVQYQDLVFKFWPGKMLQEIANNLVDDNLNGIIDENNGAVIGEPPNQITTYQYITNGTGVKYINYITGEGSDNPMLDERRDDGKDNDGDWDPRFDDVGADGVAFTNDPGEKDGIANSGEPHFDKTDISETDMIGLSSFTLYIWEDCPHYDDEKVWNNNIPGAYDDYLEGNVELMYGSGYFPVKAGQTERFSMGIACGINLDDFTTNIQWVEKAYTENYNFAKAPNVPTVTAVCSNRKVTLMWDDLAEKSLDPITGMDFEGYRIYRSTDPGWNDMLPITDGQGSVTYRKPIAQFDLINEYEGYGEVPLKGVQFDLGKNTGLAHSWTDSTVKNGFTYYYAVTSYDHGDPEKGIPPTECSKFISIATSGQVDKGSNVVIVRPEAPSAGYIPANATKAELLAGGTADGKIYCNIMQPDSVKDGHTYRITFEDTLLGTQKNIPGTKNFTLTDMTAGREILSRDTMFHDGDDVPVVHGFRLAFTGNPEMLALNSELSLWNRDTLNEIAPANLAAYRQKNEEARLQSCNFQVIMGEMGIDTSVAFTRANKLLPAIPLNFKILNVSLGGLRMRCAFREQDAVDGEEGRLTSFTDGNRKDEIILLNDDGVAGWVVSFGPTTGDPVVPQPGDTVTVVLDKPFLPHDVYEFTVHQEATDPARVMQDLEKIKAVPNPYVVANSWEPKNPYASGRGPRQLHFIHLPP